MTFLTNSPAAHAPEGAAWAWNLETTAGTANTTGSTTILEPFANIDTSPQRDSVDYAEFGGVMTDIVGSDELTRYDQITWTGYLRPDGFSAQALFLLLGSQAYTPPASAPGLHTAGTVPTHNRLNTLTCWYQTAIDATQGNWTNQYVRATITSWHLTFGPTGAATVEVGMWVTKPSYIAIPTGGKWVGDTSATGPLSIERIKGNQGTFSIFGASGSNYNLSPLSGDITVSRPLEVKFTSDQSAVQDFVAGPVDITGSMVAEFTGYTGNTIGADFDTYAPGGTSANPHTIRFTATSGNYVEFVSFPWFWNSFGLDRGGRYVKMNCGFRGSNDPAQAFKTSPTVTKLRTVNVRNNRTTALIN